MIRSVFKSHQLVNTPLTLMSKGAFVLMKIPLYQGGESRRRMAANARRNDEMNRKRIIMPCTPSAPSTQSSMPLLLLGPPPYRILNILAYYRWSLALPSTLRKGISSVASSSPPCLDERRILFLCPPLDSSTPRLSYRRGDSCQAGLSLTSVGPVPTSHFTTLPLRDYCTAIFN